MKRRDYDRNIKANTIEEAAKKFADYLIKNGHPWAAEEIIECVENGYFCLSNATLHHTECGKVTHPETADWTYFWAIENVDGNKWYAWFIERN